MMNNTFKLLYVLVCVVQLLRKQSQRKRGQQVCIVPLGPVQHIDLQEWDMRLEEEGEGQAEHQK